ncbi:MAG: hypothetical protein JXO48_04415 [Deltaproteobacteria bacterium]|nr:hypothetical protein [Deltaproteobacteria bacterium]
MIDLGTFSGKKGLERLREEVEALLDSRRTVIVAVAGLPGSGKTHMVKKCVRFGFGSFGKDDVAVIDDNTVYTTRFWRLQWDKLKGGKEEIAAFVRSAGAEVLFFSNWIPGRFIDHADIMVYLEAPEGTRLRRLKKRYRKEPEKYRIQKAKRTIPEEPAFRCERSMTIMNDSPAMTVWFLSWILRRLVR